MQSGGARGEREAVRRTRAVAAEHFQVVGRAIALVAVKAVLGVFLVEFEHEPVSRDFGDDGSSHAWENRGVRPHNSFLRYGQIKPNIPIYNQQPDR